MAKPTNENAHEKIEQAIIESLAESPNSTRTIAKETGEHHTLVARILRKRFVFRGGRWVWRGKQPNDNPPA